MGLVAFHLHKKISHGSSRLECSGLEIFCLLEVIAHISINMLSFRNIVLTFMSKSLFFSKCNSWHGRRYPSVPSAQYHALDIFLAFACIFHRHYTTIHLLFLERNDFSSPLKSESKREKFS